MFSAGCWSSQRRYSIFSCLCVRLGNPPGRDAYMLRSLLRLWLDSVLCAGSSELAVHSDVSCLVILVFVDGFVR